MSQKELNYIEDIYNHEIMLINILEDYSEIINENYKLESLKKDHEKFINNLEKLIEGEIK